MADSEDSAKPGIYGSLKDDQTRLYEYATKALQKINKFRRIHVALFLLTFFLNGTTLLAFSYWVLETEPHCTLFSIWSIEAVGKDGGPFILQEDESRFGDFRHCQMVQYIFASGAIAAFVLMWFFLIFQPSIKRLVQKRSSHAARIVGPGLVLSTLFLVLVTAGAVDLTAGYSKWCSSFGHDNPVGMRSCSDAAKVLVREGYPLHLNHIQTSLVVAFLSVICWGANLYVLVHRIAIHVDFPPDIYGSYRDPLACMVNWVPG